jgi:hypothetical protein
VYIVDKAKTMVMFSLGTNRVTYKNHKDHTTTGKEIEIKKRKEFRKEDEE